MDNLWKKYHSNLLNQGVTKLRVNKLKTMYDIVIRAIDLEKATREDIEKFVEDLHNDLFTKKDGKPYSGSTKSDLKKFLKQFYKWLRGNNEFYPKEVVWLKTKIPKDEMPIEKEVLTIEEVKKLASRFNRDDLRLMVLLLFDSGFRIQEMRSVKKKDLSLEEFDKGSKCYWLNCNSSKTLTRKIPVPLFTDEIQFFTNSQKYKGLKDNDVLFNVSYKYISETILSLAKKYLGKRVTSHALRHSSATYYARELGGNSMALAQRYGWAFNSKELQTYIRRSGAYQKDSAKKVYINGVSKLEAENEILKERLKQLETKFTQIEEINDIVKQMDKVKTTLFQIQEGNIRTIKLAQKIQSNI